MAGGASDNENAIPGWSGPTQKPEFTLDIKQQIGKMFNDIYFGNGEPAITVRLERGENRMDTLEENVKTIRTFMTRVMIASISSAISVVLMFVAELLLKHLK